MFDWLSGLTLDNLWLQLSLLLTVALVSSFLFARFGQPKMLGQILIGVIIGPSVLGLISVGAGGATGDMVQRFAELGAIILMFMIGLECDIRQIYTGRSIVIAVGGVVLPWLAGFALADLMLPAAGAGFSRFAQSVFVGAALVATSVAITAGVLKELKLLGSDVAKALLGAAVVDDVLGMIVLAVSAGTATNGGVDYGGLLWLLIASTMFVAVGALFGAKVATRLIASVHRRFSARGVEEAGFVLALILAFVYSVVSETIGISAIVGAFVAGTSLARMELGTMFKRQMSVLEWVFVPIFFLSLGALVDIGQMTTQAWLFAAALTAVAFASKIAGCWIPARLVGMSSEEALTVGVGMVPRMEVAMIIGLYGLTVGIISQEIYSVIVIMGLLTTLFAPELLRRTIARHAPIHSPDVDVRAAGEAAEGSS